MAGHSPSARGFGFFEIMVDLTKEGFENIDEITKIIFQVVIFVVDFIKENKNDTFFSVYKYAQRRGYKEMDFRRIL